MEASLDENDKEMGPVVAGYSYTRLQLIFCIRKSIKSTAVRIYEERGLRL